MNIILIGFMASGKTTIGRALAQKLNMHHIDTDDIIVSQQKQEIQHLFNEFGEAYFRLLEKNVIEQLEGLDGYVISVGGGAVMFHNNLEKLKRVGITFFLDSPLEKILENLKGKFRPLVGNTIDDAKMKELLEKRYPTYKKADFAINTEKLDIMQTVDEIIQKLEP